MPAAECVVSFIILLGIFLTIEDDFRQEILKTFSEVGDWFYGFIQRFKSNIEDEKTGYEPRPDVELAHWLDYWLDTIMQELGWDETWDSLHPDRQKQMQEINHIVQPDMRKVKRYIDDVVVITTTDYLASYTDRGHRTSREIKYRSGEKFKTVYLLEEREHPVNPSILRKGQWVDHLHDLHDRALDQRNARQEAQRLKELEELHERYGDVD